MGKVAGTAPSCVRGRAPGAALPGGGAAFLRHVKQVPFMQFNLVRPVSHVQLCGRVRLKRWNRPPES